MEPLSTPRVFSGRYELTHLIARGGMAQVYRARDNLLDRPVALKVLFPELSVDRAFVERFRREAQAAANLSHPNIVPVFDWGEDDGTYFIVMEFVDGRPLSAVLRSAGPLTAERTAEITVQVAAALGYAHRHGVVHRDVKPGNVLITDDGQVKVTDFGIARAINTEESLTQTGAVMGTATYFSPEQAEGVGVDARSDIYSLGVVLFEMVAGRPPFLGDTPVAVASKHVRDQAPILSELNPSVPPGLEAIIARAMAKNPDNRYPTAEELAADLSRFLEGRPISASAVTALNSATNATESVPIQHRTEAMVMPESAVLPDGASRLRRRRTRRLTWALVVLVVVLAAIVFLLGKSFGWWDKTSITMPDVIGESVQQATSAVDNKGAVVSATNPEASVRPAGTVVGSSPKSGASLTKGEHVILFVSTGPVIVKVSVPSVIGNSLTQAISTLQGDNLNYKLAEEPSSKPANTVLKESPGPGTRVAEGTRITLTVPATSTKATVPMVAGDTQAAAGAAIVQANLTVGTVTMQSSTTVPQGDVISTDPPAGTEEPPNTAVNLIVSSGAGSVIVENVIGDTEAQATSVLQSQNLMVVDASTQVCTPNQIGNVVDQNPEGGTSTTEGTTVTITVCNLTATSTSTSTTAPSSTPSTLFGRDTTEPDREPVASRPQG